MRARVDPARRVWLTPPPPPRLHRCPSGQATLQLAPDATLQTLNQAIKDKSGIDTHRQERKSHSPPRRPPARMCIHSPQPCSRPPPLLPPQSARASRPSPSLAQSRTPRWCHSGSSLASRSWWSSWTNRSAATWAARRVRDRRRRLRPRRLCSLARRVLGRHETVTRARARAWVGTGRSAWSVTAGGWS